MNNLQLLGYFFKHCINIGVLKHTKKKLNNISTLQLNTKWYGCFITPYLINNKVNLNINQNNEYINQNNNTNQINNITSLLNNNTNQINNITNQINNNITNILNNNMNQINNITNILNDYTNQINYINSSHINTISNINNTINNTMNNTSFVAIYNDTYSFKDGILNTLIDYKKFIKQNNCEDFIVNNNIDTLISFVNSLSNNDLIKNINDNFQYFPSKSMVEIEQFIEESFNNSLINKIKYSKKRKLVNSQQLNEI